MKKTVLFTAISVIIYCNFACSKGDASTKEQVEPAKSIELTTKQGEKVAADNRFGLKMFKEVSGEPNTFFSPLSLNLALGMLYNGASGDTRVEMAEVLGMGEGMEEEEVNQYYQKIAQALLHIDLLTQIGIANSIWYRIGLPVKQPFIDTNKKYFDAEVQALDFDKPNAADIINTWCANKTKDRIKEIIDSPIDPDVMMYLINALYFKSKWQFEFDKKQTKQDDFTKAGNTKKKVNMMEQTTTLPYYANDYLQCVEMPYGNEAFSMVAILPADDTDIDHLIEYLDDSSWQNVVSNLYPSKVWLKLPRFKIECEIPLNEPVRNAGVEQIFRGGLFNISDTPLAVTNIKQKTFVEVNEEGTEAAAVTVIEIRQSTGLIIEYEPIPFFANRPFLYLIKEKSTGVILFIGRMDEPMEG